jgi:hypothetical protein
MSPKSEVGGGASNSRWESDARGQGKLPISITIRHGG